MNDLDATQEADDLDDDEEHPEDKAFRLANKRALKEWRMKRLRAQLPATGAELMATGYFGDGDTDARQLVRWLHHIGAILVEGVWFPPDEPLEHKDRRRKDAGPDAQPPREFTEYFSCAGCGIQSRSRGTHGQNAAARRRFDSLHSTCLDSCRTAAA